jgi:uncharacterized membrane protein
VQTNENGRSAIGSDDGDGGDEASGPPKLSHIIEEHIEVAVPRQAAYDQWMRFGDHEAMFKKESAERKGDDRVRFTSKIGPSKRTWEATIVEQVPSRRVSWRSKSGPKNLGVVSFHRLGDNLTRVMVEMEHEPSGAMETVGTFLRMPRRRVRKDLRLFKNFVELRGDVPPSGADQRIGSRRELMDDEGDDGAARERVGAGREGDGS